MPGTPTGADEKPPSETQRSPTTKATRRDVGLLVIGLAAYAAWFYLSIELVGQANRHLFPYLFPEGIFRPHAQPQALLLQAALLLVIGLGLGALCLPSRRGWGVRVLPTSAVLLAISFWLGGGEVSQLDERGLWRTHALGVADESVAWQGIRTLELRPYVWRQRALKDGMETGLGLRVLVVPKVGHATVFTVLPDTNLLRLAKLLDAHRDLVKAEVPTGSVASVFRFHRHSPQALLLSEFVTPAPAPAPRPSLAPVDPVTYWWYRRHKRRM